MMQEWGQLTLVWWIVISVLSYLYCFSVWNCKSRAEIGKLLVCHSLLPCTLRWPWISLLRCTVIQFESIWINLPSSLALKWHRKKPDLSRHQEPLFPVLLLSHWGKGNCFRVSVFFVLYYLRKWGVSGQMKPKIDILTVCGRESKNIQIWIPVAYHVPVM